MNGLKATLAGIYAALILLLILTGLKTCDRPVADTPDETPMETAAAVDTAVETPPDSESALMQEPTDSAPGRKGHLRVAMRWDFQGDADLHVVAPGARCIDYSHSRDTQSGGRKDVDNTKGGTGSAENIYWDEPPTGEYSVYLHYFPHVGQPESQGPVKVIVETTDDRGESHSETFAMTLSQVKEWKGVCRFSYGDDGSIRFSAPASQYPDPALCRVRRTGRYNL